VHDSHPPGQGQTDSHDREQLTKTRWRAGEPTLDDVQHEFPQWRCSRGYTSLCYAKQETTGHEVTGEDPLDLRDQIKAAEARQALNRQRLPESSPGTGSGAR
jgi:hypothetical protein